MSNFGKRVLSIACCVACVTMMTACASPSDRLEDIDEEISVDESADNSKMEKAEADESADEASTEDTSEEVTDVVTDEISDEVSDDVSDKVNAPFESDVDPYSMYAFEVDGKNYEVPMELSKFLDSGWFYSEYNSSPEVLEAGEDAEVHMYYASKAIVDVDFGVKNYSTSPLPIEKCTVYAISLGHDAFEDAGTSFSIHGGDITFGSTPDEIEAVMGEFDNDIGEGNVHLAMYFQDHNNRDRDHMIMFNFTGGDDHLMSVEIEYED